MSSDKSTGILLEALKQGLAEQGEQRLYRSGKLAGLFSSKTGIHGETAAAALRDGMIEVVRSETKGKTTVEWVRVTSKGVDFVAEHESPVRAMHELRAALAATREGLPEWVGHIRRSLQDLSERLTTEVQGVMRRLDVLSARVEEALRQAGERTPPVPAAAADAFPWALDAVAYLDRRREGNVNGPCPLPELFAAVDQPALSVSDFHTGLRRLQDRGVLKLLPFEQSEELPQPEFALLDGTSMFYYAAR
jgi:hypothetical protein